MIELLRQPIVIPGKIPSMSNLHVSWRSMRIPRDRVKHAGARARLKRFDEAMAWKDAAVALMRANATASAPKGQKVFIHAVVAFKAGKRTNEADLPNDVDNPSKILMDSLQKAGIVENDKQVVFLLLEKVCAAGEPELTLRSVCAARRKDKRRWLAGLTLQD